MSSLPSVSPSALNSSPILAPLILPDDEFRRWKLDLASRLAWLNDDDANDIDDYRPDWQGDRYEPTPEEDARRLGFDLGRANEPAKPSRGMSIRVQDAWYNGWLAGNLARVEAERRELNDWFDSMEEPDWDSMDPDFDPLHAIERTEAGPMRREGGVE